MPSWKVICNVNDIPLLGARRVAREHGSEVALFRTHGDKVFALLDRCPHKGGPLSQGIVLADGVTCPLHNWTIQWADGCARAPDAGCTPRFAVRVEGGAVLLDLDELRSHGLSSAAADTACPDPAASPVVTA